MVKATINPLQLVLALIAVAGSYAAYRVFTRADKVVNKLTKPLVNAYVNLMHDDVNFTNAGIVLMHEDFDADYALRGSIKWQAMLGAHPAHKAMLAELFDYNRRLKPKYRHFVGTVIITPELMGIANG